MNTSTIPHTSTTYTPLTVSKPVMKAKTKFCGVCGTPIDSDSKELALIGPIGPQCYRKFAGIEDGLKPIEGVKYTDEMQANGIRDGLKRLGLKSKLVRHGHIFRSETWKWSIEITGYFRETKSTKLKYGSFKENRARYAQHLQNAARKRREAVQGGAN